MLKLVTNIWSATAARRRRLLAGCSAAAAAAAAVDWLLLLAVGQLDIAAVSMASTYRWTYDPIQLYMI